MPLKSNTCIVGCGYWGEKVLNSVQNNKNFSLKYLVDKSNSILKNIKKKYNLDNISTHKDYKKINLDQIDSVFIVVPPKYHFKIAKYFLKNNINVFIEKPVVQNLNDFIILKKIAEKNKKIIMPGDLYLYHPAILKIKKILSQNKLGIIKYIDFNRLNNGIIRSDVNLVENLSTHDLSILFFLLGNLKLKQARLFKQRIISKKNYDIYNCNLIFFSGLKVTIKLSWLYPEKIRNFTILGTKKRLFYDDLNPSKILVTNRRIVNYTSPKYLGKNHIIKLKKLKKKPLDLEIDYFYNCIKKGYVPRSTYKMTENILTVLKKIN